MNDFEVALAESFVAMPKRRRLLSLLESASGRTTATRLLDHWIDLDPRYARLLSSKEQADVAGLLERLGAPPTCYVWSVQRDVDGRTMPLRDALDQVVGSLLGTFVSCIPRRLAYFQAEDRGRCFVCHRP